MNIKLSSSDITHAINDYIRKNGVNGKVTQVSYADRFGDWTEVGEATVLFEKEDE